MSERTANQTELDMLILEGAKKLTLEAISVLNAMNAKTEMDSVNVMVQTIVNCCVHSAIKSVFLFKKDLVEEFKAFSKEINEELLFLKLVDRLSISITEESNNESTGRATGPH